MTDNNTLSPRTKTVQAEVGTDTAFGSVPPALYLSSTYRWPSVAQKGEYDYGRTNNPNRDGLAHVLSSLEGGAGAVITSSGMAAIDLVFNLLSTDESRRRKSARCGDGEKTKACPHRNTLQPPYAPR